jgi:hypothetical protein
MPDATVRVDLTGIGDKALGKAEPAEAIAAIDGRWRRAGRASLKPWILSIGASVLGKTVG